MSDRRLPQDLEPLWRAAAPMLHIELVDEERKQRDAFFEAVAGYMVSASAEAPRKEGKPSFKKRLAGLAGLASDLVDGLTGLDRSPAQGPNLRLVSRLMRHIPTDEEIDNLTRKSDPTSDYLPMSRAEAHRWKMALRVEALDEQGTKKLVELGGSPEPDPLNKLTLELKRFMRAERLVRSFPSRPNSRPRHDARRKLVRDLHDLWSSTSTAPRLTPGTGKRDPVVDFVMATLAAMPSWLREDRGNISKITRELRKKG
jgi:hypothetical protein